MQLAQSYLQGMGSPFDGVLEAYGQGQVLRQNKDTLQAQQAEQARKIAAQQALETIDWNDQQAVAQIVAQFPEYTKGAQDYYSNMEAKEQQAMLFDMSTSISALGSERPDIAVQNMRDKAAAYRDARNEEKAEEYSQMAEWMARDPQSARKALMMQYAVLSPKDSGSNLKSYGEALNPQRKEVDAGDAIHSYQIDPTTGEIISTDWIVDKEATPDNVLDNQTSVDNNIRTVTASENNNIRSNTVSENNNIRSNQTSQLNAQLAAEMKRYGIDVNAENAQQKLQHERQQAAIKNKQGELKEAGGKYYFVNKSGQVFPALDQNGQQLIATNATKPLNESQTKDKWFGTRMEKANDILNKLEKGGVYRGSLLSRTGDWGENIANKLPSAVGGNSPEQQQYIQAQRDFINAVLRRESGAVIAETEFANAQKQYFPVVGDSQAVIKQKRTARENVAKELLSNVPGYQGGKSSGSGSLDLSDLFGD